MSYSFYADICTSLVSLFCHNNHLAVLNVDGCTSLDVLECSNNQLTSLETSTCHKLRNIMCDNNLIEQISYPRSLENFSCINNRITAKVPSWFSELIEFRCDYLYEYTGYDYDNENGYIRCTHMVGGMKVNQTVGLCIIIKVKQDG